MDSMSYVHHVIWASSDQLTENQTDQISKKKSRPPIVTPLGSHKG